jgi:quercetin dioxygenase-like cupin family protein
MAGGLWRTWRSLGAHPTGDGLTSRVYVDEGVDVWLLTWAGLQSTGPHDHCLSTGSLTVVHGELELGRETGNGALVRRRVLTGESATTRPGVVHEVRNSTSDVAVSVHAYSPPLPCGARSDPGPSGFSVIRTLVGEGAAR